MSTPKLTASYVTLAGAGFAEPPRFTFRQRCEAASAAGFARIGIHLNDLKTLNDRRRGRHSVGQRPGAR